MSEAKSMAKALGAGGWSTDGLCILGCGEPGINGVGACRECVERRKKERKRDANELADRDIKAWQAFRWAWRGNSDDRGELERRFIKHCPHYSGLMTRWVAAEKTRPPSKGKGGY